MFWKKPGRRVAIKVLLGTSHCSTAAAIAGRQCNLTRYTEHEERSLFVQTVWGPGRGRDIFYSQVAVLQKGSKLVSHASNTKARENPREREQL